MGNKSSKGVKSSKKHQEKKGIESPRASNQDPQSEPVTTPPPAQSTPEPVAAESKAAAASSSSSSTVQQQPEKPLPTMNITVIGDGGDFMESGGLVPAADTPETPEKKFGGLSVDVNEASNVSLEGLKSPMVKFQDTKTLGDQEHLAVDFPEGYKNSFRRRGSVSAEVDKDPNAPLQPRVIEKTQEQKATIRAIVNSPMNFLFAGLDEEQKGQVIDATEIVNVQPGDDVIRQYHDGDLFYIIGSGVYEVYKCFGPQSEPGEEKHVFQYENKGTFGELSLMYNAPRAATVRAKTEGTLYAMDRQTFRMIIVESTIKKHQMYGDFIDQVPLLQNLTHNERVQIVDGLVAHEYNAGDSVLTQGDAGESMYIIEHGEVAVTQIENGEKKEVRVLKESEFFGELALLEKITRTSSVTAVSETRCLLISREAFERLFGDVRSVMNRRAEKLYSDRRNSVAAAVESKTKEDAVEAEEPVAEAEAVEEAAPVEAEAAPEPEAEAEAVEEPVAEAEAVEEAAPVEEEVAAVEEEVAAVEEAAPVAEESAAAAFAELGLTGTEKGSVIDTADVPFATVTYVLCLCVCVLCAVKVCNVLTAMCSRVWHFVCSAVCVYIDCTQMYSVWIRFTFAHFTHPHS
jgi:cAMP-dependent protein kinase regulator